MDKFKVGDRVKLMRPHGTEWYGLAAREGVYATVVHIPSEIAGEDYIDILADRYRDIGGNSSYWYVHPSMLDPEHIEPISAADAGAIEYVKRELSCPFM